MTDILDSALALAFTGLPVFPCAADKRPACENGLYDASTDPDTIARLFANPRAALIGVPAGPESGFDAIDIDTGRDGLAWLTENESRLPATRRHHSRSGGVHILLKHTAGMRTKFDKIARGVEVRGEGGYIIWWPAHGNYAAGTDFAAWPEWLLIDALRGTRQPGAAPADPAELAPPAAADLIALLRDMPNPADTSRGDYVALNLAVQGCIRGLEALNRCDADTAEEIRDAAADWSSRWDSDRARDYETERALWESDWSVRDNDLSGWRHILGLAERLGVPVSGHRLAAAAAEFGTVADPVDSRPAEAAPAAPVDSRPPAPAADPGDPYWQSKLTLAKGVPVANLANLMFALRRAPQWAGVFKLDTFTGKTTLTRQPPTPGEWTGPREITDADFPRVAEWFQNNALNMSITLCESAIHAVADESRFSSLADYLNGLTWDGTPRADAWLVDYLGAADTPLMRIFGARFLIAAVARGFMPGCQVDTILVLEGEQGLKKSSALRALAGSAWFTDHIPDLSTKDAAIQLQGMWLIEHAEMATLGRTDAARAKEFISRRVDRFRVPHGRVASDFPRQSVFVASVNPSGSGYLRDETGARRYWTIACGATWPEGQKVDADALAAVRDQLWAEAVHRFRAGERHWLDSHSLENEQAALAGARFDADTWTDEIEKFATGKPFVRMPDVLASLGLQVRDQRTEHQHRAGRVLRAIGWRPKVQWLDGKAIRTFVAPPGSPILPEQPDRLADLR